MRLRPIPQLVHFVRAALVVLAASLTAALLPAWRAARLKPAEALRFVG
jgi:ABC-type lipoprotein release transport system permease subunit